jgi:hypothetical protein
MSSGSRKIASDLQYKKYSGEFVWQIHNFSKLIGLLTLYPWKTKNSSPITISFGSHEANFLLKLQFDSTAESIGLFVVKIGIVDFQCDISLSAIDRNNIAFLSNHIKKLSTSDENKWGFPNFFTDKVIKTVIPNRLTAEGALKIVFKVTFEGAEVVENPIGNYKSCELLDDMHKLLKNSVMPDFTIRCGDEVLHCHKAILALRSDVFERMFENKSSKENTKNEVEIIDCEPEIMKDFLQFLYTDRVEGEHQRSYNSIDLLLMADKYNVLGLKKKCELALAKQLHVKNAIELLIVASKISAPILKPKAANFIFKNLDELVESDDWDEMAETNPALLNDIFKFRSM